MNLDVVTLNIQFGRRIERARQLFDRTRELGRAQLVLLQEMDAEGTQSLADALGMSHVYCPATVHAKTGREFGNAVLSRWPIVAHRKIPLPHLSLRDRSPRVATCATVRSPFGPLEVCSLHLATPLELFPRQRREQVCAVLDELSGASRLVLGGDFNSHGLCRLASARPLHWATRHVGPTLSLLSVDHIFAQGFSASHAGKVDSRGASDHAAVWARLVASDQRSS